LNFQLNDIKPKEYKIGIFFEIKNYPTSFIGD